MNVVIKEVVFFFLMHYINCDNSEGSSIKVLDSLLVII
jgi:hypothetical protein